jgi:hypothetical protein
MSPSCWGGTYQTQSVAHITHSLEGYFKWPSSLAWYSSNGKASDAVLVESPLATGQVAVLMLSHQKLVAGRSDALAT